ncbi:hypothetical protein KY358_02920 [Candidatus Woesearchaeota archaeon]|nr:hypothetical protein [Candidatus Woesearchaeota archaeon]
MSQLNDLKETFIEEYSSAKILKGMKKPKAQPYFSLSPSLPFATISSI